MKLTQRETSSATAVDINPAAALRMNAQYLPNAVAIHYGGRDITYTELEDRAARLATVLTACDVVDGDRVAYLGLNSDTFLVTMLAAFRIGAIFVPINFRVAEAELRLVLSLSEAAILVCEPGHRPLVDQVQRDTSLRHLLLVDDDPECPPQLPIAAPWEPISRCVAHADTAPAMVLRQFNDPAILMFTSGTTGVPKGVVLTHGNIWWNGVNVDSRLDTRRGDVTHVVAPLFHVGGLNALALRTLVRGGTLVVRRGFEPRAFLRDLVDYQVNSLFAVPTMLAALAAIPELSDTHLPDLRTVVVAGAPVPTSLIQKYSAHGIWLQQAWGLTETAPFATHLPAEHTLAKLGSAGIPMPYTQVRVIDPATGAPVDPGVRGEIVVRGPNVTPGYWKNPDATNAAFDDAGWFHSGDIGYLDEDGYLFIVDRLKDMIISGGENIYPAEVERALADLPGLVDVAVVGVPDERWGETVVAVAAFANTTPPTIDDVRQHGAEVLAAYKLPRRLVIVDAVPRNASGKLDKPAIRRWVIEDQ